MFQLLVSFGASLFIENSAKETPCDCAEKAGHAQIALYLESKMVFSVKLNSLFSIASHFYARQHICYSASLRQRRVRLSVRPSVRHTPVLCLAERKQDREMYTI